MSVTRLNPSTVYAPGDRVIVKGLELAAIVDVAGRDLSGEIYYCRWLDAGASVVSMFFRLEELRRG